MELEYKEDRYLSSFSMHDAFHLDCILILQQCTLRDFPILLRNCTAVWNVMLLTYLLHQPIQISEGMLSNLILFYLFISYLT